MEPSKELGRLRGEREAIGALAVEWLWDTGSEGERALGRSYGEVIAEAIGGLQEQERLRGVRMRAVGPGRLAVVEGWLEVGFGEGMAPPSVQEMRDLLSLIL
ncbi:MAG: hypothetical protein ACK532_10940 [Acidobacteriota bacterium]